jgi:hypothetical protein
MLVDIFRAMDLIIVGSAQKADEVVSLLTQWTSIQDEVLMLSRSPDSKGIFEKFTAAVSKAFNQGVMTELAAAKTQLHEEIKQCLLNTEADHPCLDQKVCETLRLLSTADAAKEIAGESDNILHLAATGSNYKLFIHHGLRVLHAIPDLKIAAKPDKKTSETLTHMKLARRAMKSLESTGIDNVCKLLLGDGAAPEDATDRKLFHDSYTEVKGHFDGWVWFLALHDNQRRH